MRAALVAGALMLAACGSEHTEPPRPEPKGSGARHLPPPADAAPARGYVGVITAAESVDIAARFPGVLARVLVRAGDAVTAGQVVAELDPKQMEEDLRGATAALGAASAAKRQADVDTEDARRKLVLETKAVANGVSPQSALEEAKLAVRRAEAAAQRAAATIAAESSRVQTARDHLADTTLRAPAAGIVGMRFKDPGATVGVGVPIVRIVGQNGLRLRFAVPPDRSRDLTVGAAVHATIDTLDKPVRATIRQVSPALDPASGMVVVEAELDPSDPNVTRLRPGLAAWVAPG